jgi:putative aldouronate transport system substrate-binding protein
MGKSKVSKSLCLLLSMLMVASICTSCKGSSQSSSGSASSGSATANLQPYELVWYKPGMGSVWPDSDKVTAALSTMLKKKINATLKIQTIDYSTYGQKMTLAISAGEKWDFCYTSNWLNDYLGNSAKGAYEPLDDLLSKYGKELVKSMPSYVLDAAKINGKIYGIPTNQCMAMIRGWCLKKDIVDKYHIDVSKIKSMDDLTPLLKDVKENDPQMYPIFAGMSTFQAGDLNNYNTGYVLELATSSSDIPLYINVKNKDFKVFDVIPSDQFKHYANLMRSWYKSGYIRPDAATVKDTLAEVKTGKYAVFSPGGIAPGDDATYESRYGFPVDVVWTSYPVVASSSILSGMTAINKSSKDPARAMMAVNLFYTDQELYRMFCNGIEGEDYTMADSTHVKATAKSKYNPSMDFLIGNVMNNYLRVGQASDLHKQIADLNKSAAVSPLNGFNFDASKVKTQIAQVSAVVMQYYPVISTGSGDPNSVLAEFDKKCKEAGLDDIMKEAQTQIDAWRASNK